MDLRSTRHAFGQNVFHFVWKPKYAKDPMKFLGIRADCERFIREVAEKYRFGIYELHIAVDHIHLFVEMPPTMSVNKALQLFKGITSYKLLQKHPWLRRHFKKDISGVLESSSEVLVIRLAMLLSTTSVLLSLGLI